MPPPPESAEAAQKLAVGSVSTMKEATVSVQSKESKEATVSGQPANIAGIELLSASQMARKLWFVFALSGLCNVFNMLEVNIYLPYLYSRVQCCEHGGVLLASKYDAVKQDNAGDLLKAAILLGSTMNLTRDEAGFFHLPACSLPHFPAGHELWSMSSKCRNKAFVQDTAQQILSMSQPIQKGLGILVLPVASAMADVKGRVPVMAAFISCLVLACFCFAADACGLMSGNALVIMGGAMLFPAWDPKDAIINGVIADMLGNAEANKNRAFSSSFTINIFGSVVCSAISFFCIRLRLASYVLPWLAFCGLALSILVFLYFCVPETLPEHLKQPIQLSMFNPFQAHLRSLSLLGRDRVLVLLAVISFVFSASFVGFVVTLFSYLCMIGFSMEEALLPGTVGNAATALFALILVPQLPRLGVWRASLLGHSCWILAYMLWGPVSIMCGKAFPYVAGCVQSLAFLLTVPSLQTMVSQRVSESDQAKCQGAIGAINVLGYFVGIAFYNAILFDATAQGLERSRPALVSGCLAAVCLALTAVARKWDSTSHKIILSVDDSE